MFSNTGNKIKNLAYGFFGGGVFGSLIFPLFCWDSLGLYLGLLCVAVCIGVFYCVSLLIYGFGVIVDNSENVLNSTLVANANIQEDIWNREDSKENNKP